MERSSFSPSAHSARRHRNGLCVHVGDDAACNLVCKARGPEAECLPRDSASRGRATGHLSSIRQRPRRRRRGRSDDHDAVEAGQGSDLASGLAVHCLRQDLTLTRATIPRSVANESVTCSLRVRTQAQPRPDRRKLCDRGPFRWMKTSPDCIDTAEARKQFETAPAGDGASRSTSTFRTADRQTDPRAAKKSLDWLSDARTTTHSAFTVRRKPNGWMAPSR